MDAIKSNGSFNDLVFENRHKEYGAYELRKSYDDHLVKAMLIAWGAAILLILLTFFHKDKTIPDIDFFPPTKVVTIKNPEILKTKILPSVQKTIHRNHPKANNPRPVVTDTSITLSVDTAKAGNGGKDGDIKLPIDSPPTIGGSAPTGPTGPKGPVAIPDVNPEFPGGVDAMYKFIKKHLSYPENARVAGKQGNVYLMFIVDIDGKIKDISPLTKVGYGCEDAAMRVVRLMPPWKPGILKGEPVPIFFKLPIKFKLQ